MIKKILFLSLFSIFISLNCREVIEIPRAVNPPVIDGFVGAEEWHNAYFLHQFYQTSPGDNTLPSEKTEIALMYDDNNIYLMAKCYFTDSNRMRHNHCSRDAIYTTDRCYFFFDTFGSKDRAYYLGCNANGEQADGIVLQDVDPTIDIYYISRARKTEEGFTLEILLPLQSLKYKSGRNIDWGFFFRRHLPDGPEEITSHPVQRGGGNYFDNYAILRFAELPTDRNLTIIPAVVLKYDVFEDKIAGLEKTDETLEPELNIFYEPNSSLMTRLTLNPDFNIIEADGLEIDVNNRYPRFYVEKRPFFIEQTNPFQTGINIFYTRQIVDPVMGFKISGSSDNTSIFALTAIDEAAPGSRFCVGSDYAARDENTIFGFASIARKYQNGSGFMRSALALRRFAERENFVLSWDAFKRISNVFKTDIQMAVSTNETGSADSSTEIRKGLAAALRIDYYDGKWFVKNDFKAISPDFTADLGFLEEVDICKFGNRLEYQIHAGTDEDIVRYMEFASDQNIKFTFDLQDVKSYYWNIMTGAILKNTFQYWTGIELIMDNYFGKDYYTHYPWVSLEYEPVRQLRLKTVIVTGENLFYNHELQRGEYGDYNKYETTILLRPSRFFDIEFYHKYHETENKYIARSCEAKAKIQFHKNFWLRLIMQTVDHDLTAWGENPRSISVYPLFAYKPNAHTAIYLGAAGKQLKTRPLNSREYLADHESKTYFLKISYTFDLL